MSYFLTTKLAPELTLVVFAHTLPVGCGSVPVSLQLGF